MTQYVNKLPAVFQTVTERKFFDATFDQVLSKKDSDYLAGFIGRRYPGTYNPITDFYLPEPSKNRTWWQLEPTAFARNEDTTKTNVFFYEDLLDNIEYYGGNTLNQDRLFNSEYYSFGPPIDYDMFINYYDYYWIDQRLPVITITGVMASQIIGEASFTTSEFDTPPNFTLSSGMSIILADDPDYQEPHVVENFGGCEGIGLIEYFTDTTAGAQFEFLPWDGSITLSNGRTINNLFWDAITWDTQYQPSTGDYITIERGSINKNAWSRTNKWFHIDTIRAVIAQTGTSFPQAATRALRPIIQFDANLELYNSGTVFRSVIDYGFGAVDTDPITLVGEQGRLLSAINIQYGTSLSEGDLVVFFNDETELDVNEFPWDMFAWDSVSWDNDILFAKAVNEYIFEVLVNPDGTVNFSPYTDWTTPVLEGDIVIVKEDGPGTSAQSGQTWYYENSIWQKAFNDKVSLNQPPLFQLYDHNKVQLDDPATYPLSTFRGSEIFSYKVNTEPGATVDPVLGFPIVYTGLGQASDIVFQNDLIVDRYVYTANRIPVDGYYYYNDADDPALHNAWNLYQPCMCGGEDTDMLSGYCLETSKQRVIDKYTVGYGTQYQFKLSVTPYGFPTDPDIIVIVNGREVKNASLQTNGYTFDIINGRIYVVLTDYLDNLFSTPQIIAPAVEIQTYTYGLLDPAESGFSQIPQQLEANPNQEEIGEISGSDLTEHFVSIIKGQVGFVGNSFGSSNNYRDTKKNQSIGQFILQNTTPLLKTMLVSPQGDLSFIDAVRFSNDEYSKFKNKYIKVAQQLINQAFNPVQYETNTVLISLWVEEILKIINISKEFSSAFAYSYMIANGSPFATEAHVVPTGPLLLTNYVNLSDPKNALYVYDVTGLERLLVIGEDYEITSTNLSIEITFTSNVTVGDDVYIALFKNPLPAYIPSTPSKIGAYPVYVPRMEWDATFATPTWVIIGHDGSKTIAYGTPTAIDYRDQLLLELEKRIYNLIQLRFRDQYFLPIRIESVKTGFFRETRYSREEYLNITVSYLNKWSAKNRANYRANDWLSASNTTPVDKLWKLYNYSLCVDDAGIPFNLPGNWKGIFQFMYDTYYPDTRPWEMFGFSDEPSWWRYEYGNPLINLEGQEVWGSSASGNSNLYNDIRDGIIRQGPSAIYDPEDLTVQPQLIWARPEIFSYLPVDAFGELRPVLDVTTPGNSLFLIAYSGNPYEPFDGYDHEWKYGDGSPVEQAWMSTSNYAFSVQEFLFLMRPAPYGEYMWNTFGTELSTGYITVPTSTQPVRSNNNWQFVQNEYYDYPVDDFFAWMRPKNKDQIVHAENIDGKIQVQFGYQRWISDRILFLGKNITSTFGQKVRTLDVNLANKFAGFTNKDTTNTYIESVTSGSLTNSLIIPSTNFDVLLHKSPVVETFSYSGVVIRALADGTFMVYGYDLLSSEFTILNRSNAKLIDVSVGGTPAEFQYFTVGATYQEGEIVRYNGTYYLSNVVQTVQKFEVSSWTKLKTLPTVGGVSVTYKPISAESITKIPYGAVLKNTQEVFDFLIGWGAWLEKQGWQFVDVNQETNQLSDWLYAGKQFLFWLNSSWSPDASIQLSPLANKATLLVNRGYPNDVETMSNGVYSILDKFGIAIAPIDTVTDRDGRLITVSPNSLSAGGIYYLQVNVSETEHVLIFDNETNFNDTIYSPLLRARQQRLRFNGFRSNGWYGKMEAPGYLIIEDQLVPNFDTIVNAMRYYYDPNVTIDNPSLEDLGRHLIGYESKSYLDNLQVSNDVQYLFYQGAIRQKGTIQSLDKLFRSTKIQSNESLEIYEEWVLKKGDFGNTVEQVSTEFVLVPEQNTGEIVVSRMNYKPSSIGVVKQINILNAQIVYSSVPSVFVGAPDADPMDINLTSPLRQAKAYAVLGANNIITRIDITDPGYGYLKPPIVVITSPENPDNVDTAYSVWQGQIMRDINLDNVIDIDIDETNLWTVRPIDPTYSLEFPLTPRIEYPLPNAGYVNFNDVDFASFDVEQTIVNWGSLGFDPERNSTVWVAKTFTEDWDVYKLVSIAPDTFEVIEDLESLLWLRTDENFLITPQFVTSGNANTDFGNIIVLQVTEKQAVAEAIIKPPTAPAILPAGSPFVPVGAEAFINSLTGDSIVTGTSAVTITRQGNSYTSPAMAAVTISAPLKTQATATTAINVNTGAVTGITLSNPGLGYTTGTTASIDLPVPITAQANAIINLTTGQVTGINITSGGLGYFPSDPPTITIDQPGERATASASISGSGAITGVTITNPGAGYLSATITMGPWPGPLGPSTATAASGVSGGSVFASLLIPGSGYAFPPLITISPPIKTQATAIASVTSGTVTGISVGVAGAGYISPPTVSISAPTFSSATGSASIGTTPSPVTGISLDSPGAGYASAPVVTISGGGGSGATAEATVANGIVTGLNLTNGGSGYTSVPTVFIGGPNGTPAQGVASLTGTFSVAFIQVTNAGSGYTSPPTVTLSDPTAQPAIASATVSQGTLTGISMNSSGSGYTSPPSIIIGPPNGSAATLTPNIVNGSISSISITSPGGGYVAAPAITVSLPNAPAATATVSEYLGGQIQTISVSTPGAGYTTVPTVTISAPVVQQATASVTTLNGEISNVSLVSPGKGYTSIPGITFSAPNGVTAQGTANLTGDNVTSVNITNGGSGYSSIPTITLGTPDYVGQVLAYQYATPADTIIPTYAGMYFPRLDAPVITVVGDGAGAEAQAIMDPMETGNILYIEFTSNGIGYSTATLEIAEPPGSGNGEIIGVNILEPGAGYDTVPTIEAVGPPIPGSSNAAELYANILDGSVVSANVVVEGTGYENTAITISAPTNFKPSSNYAVAFAFDRTEDGFNYYKLTTLIGTQITSDEIDNFAEFNKLLLFKTMRFWEEPAFGSVPYISPGDKIWVDGTIVGGVAPVNPQWTVFNTTSTEFIPYRKQEKLIDSRLFESATIFDSRSKNMLALLPVYDPFKNILPGPALQNITYTTLKDPARYNVTTNASLFSENIVFGEEQVGQLWWDLSSTRYVYYEQPRWLNADGTYGEDPTNNLAYRRDYWANLFPGSTISIYEWTKSSVPPSEYAGTGIPRDLETYVQLVSINKFTNIPETSYYFWVLNPTDRPNLSNRTLTANDVSRLLISPKSQGFMFFAPIQQTEINNSYLFYNVLEILAYRGSNIQMQYRLAERNDQAHTQWAFFREGDSTSLVTDQYWDKMVDSLCGYTRRLPVSDEYSNSILIYDDIPTAWDMFPWDSVLFPEWDVEITDYDSRYGEILPVPDPVLSEAEKYGIQYRPRQGMFVKLQPARKVFVQAANELLQYIPVRDDNPSWNVGVTTDIYWDYTNWYKPGYEDVTPNVVFQTLLQATLALAGSQLQVGDIVRVTDGTLDGRFVLYAVVQVNPNVSTLSLDEVGIENSAIKLLDTVYTTVNRYDLAVELRQLLTAFRTQVMIDENLVDQNKLFFSMVNYVLSEQKNPDWVFKSSYIFIKENNVPLTQDQLYVPDQIDNIIQYINDAKPYHTHIRDYASKYLLSDVAEGTALDFYKMKFILKFGPETLQYQPWWSNNLIANLGWDFNQGDASLPWDSSNEYRPDEVLHNEYWDNPYYLNNSIPNSVPVNVLNQFVSGNPVDPEFNPGPGNPWPDIITVDITTFDPSKVGYSGLFPYTFDYSDLTVNDPQTVVAPENIIAIKIDDGYLFYGHDYYVEYNDTDNTYTVFFFEDPSAYTVLQGMVWFNGGGIQNIEFNTFRNELALGFPEDDLVMNIDTKLPVNDIAGNTNPELAGLIYSPFVGWGSSWDGLGDPIVAQILIDEGGTSDVPWDAPLVPVILDYTISSKQNNSQIHGVEYVRNDDATAGTLVNDLLAPTLETENIQFIVVTAPTDIFPDESGVVWIDGERIEYRMKETIDPVTWKLSLLRRGTEGTAPNLHTALVPTVANPLVFVPNKVWIEDGNNMPSSVNNSVWQASNTLPDPSTEVLPDEYTSVTAVPLGGVWYAQTPAASFLKNGQGKSIL